MEFSADKLPSETSCLAEHKQPLYEVVDSANRPLCLLSEREILEQGLWGRSAFCLVRVGKSWLIGPTEDADFGFSCGGRLPALCPPEDFCAHLSQKVWGILPKVVNRLCVFMPCMENGNTFATVYEALPARGTRLNARQKAHAVSLSDLQILWHTDTTFEPFFRMFLTRGLLSSGACGKRCQSLVVDNAV